MALSFEEFKQLRSQGLSEEQIAKFDKEPSLIDKTMTNLSRPAAAVREGIRSGIAGGMDNENVLEDVGSGMKRGFMKPESSEKFQNEDLRNYYGNDKPSFLKTVGGIGPSAIGLAKDMASDPLTYAVGPVIKGLGKIPFKGITLGDRASKLPVQSMLASSKGQALKATKYATKAIKPTEQLLKPNDKEFAQSIELGTEYNPSKQASKYISPAKDYTELTDQMRLAKGMPMEERAVSYSEGNILNNRSQLDRIQSLINQESNSPQGARKANAIRDIHTKEVDFLNKQSPESMNDPKFYQSQKEYYQNLADQASAYGTDPSQSAKAEAYRALAKGYQDKTYEVDGVVKVLNLENAGLDLAGKRFSQLAQVERGQAPTSLSKEIIKSIRPSTAGSTATFFRNLTGQGYTNVPKLTKSISKSMGKAEKAKSLSNLIARMEKPEGILEYDTPLSLQGQSHKSLPPPRGRGNFKGSSSGPTINSEGNDFIQIPQVLDSDMAILAKKYGPPERYNVRDIINQANINPIVKSSSTEGLIMSKNRRKEIDQIMARRKKNFGE